MKDKCTVDVADAIHSGNASMMPVPKEINQCVFCRSSLREDEHHTLNKCNAGLISFISFLEGSGIITTNKGSFNLIKNNLVQGIGREFIRRKELTVIKNHIVTTIKLYANP